MRAISRGLFALTLLASASHAKEEARRPMMTGVNLAGAEFGEPGGAHGTGYRYPDDSEIDDIAKRGFTILRLPFLWERLQPVLSEALDAKEFERLDHVVTRSLDKKLAIILDLHNYARRGDDVIGSDSLPIAAFADVWRRLAERYKARDGVVFGLMNEPHDMKTEDWAKASQAAIDSIRATRACNRILVPGNAWTGAHSWRSNSYGTPNAIAMASVSDPAKRMTYEFHQYLDSDWSGRAPTCQRPSDVVAALAVATDWLRKEKATGFLGEIGAGADKQCLAGLSAMLAHLNANDVWKGWTAWAAGAWWPQDYPLLLRTIDGKDTPQLAIFADWIAPPDPDFVVATCPGAAPR